MEFPPALPVHALVVDRHPQDAEALRYRRADGATERLTFGDVARRSRALAARLAAAGVARGDRVLVIGPQAPETAVAHVAISRLGALSVPLSMLYGPDGLASRVADATPKLALVDATRKDALAEAAPALEAWDLREAGSMEGDATLPELAKPLALKDPFTIIYTSGTTATPKGAVLPHRVISGRMKGFLLAHPDFPKEGDLFWSPADWAWIGGLHDALFAPWACGAAVFAYERRGPFDPAAAVAILAEAGVANAFLPPTALKALMRSGVDVSPLKLRTLHTAGEPLPAPVAEWAASELRVPAREVYGLTELAFVIVNTEATPGATGRAVPGFDVRVGRDDASDSRPGEVGEIIARESTPTLMLGYWTGPKKTLNLPLGAKGYFRTGDLAVRDDSGLITFRGRKDDVIKTSGYRVGPAEIEATLLRNPAVLECAVVGVPDAARGTLIKAFVKLADPARAGPEMEAELAEMVRARLAAHEVPRAFAFVDDLPRTTSGKVRRSALREVAP